MCVCVLGRGDFASVLRVQKPPLHKCWLSATFPKCAIPYSSLGSNASWCIVDAKLFKNKQAKYFFPIFENNCGFLTRYKLISYAIGELLAVLTTGDFSDTSPGRFGQRAVYCFPAITRPSTD